MEPSLMMWLESIQRIKLVKVFPLHISYCFLELVPKRNRWFAWLENPGKSGWRVREDSI